MSTNLKIFQQRALDELLDHSKKLINNNQKDSICVFQSPTGSGKTVVSAFFILELIKEINNDNLCFLWVTIGKGDLHIQSKKSLEKIFNGYPNITLAEDIVLGNNSTIQNNEVVIVNWEKIRTKNSKNEWTNIIMKDGERINFREVLENTRKDKKLILIIDESHIGRLSGRTDELRKEIAADLTLEMSATPKTKIEPRDIVTGKSGFVYVDPKDVIEEGMIVKDIIINENLEDLKGDDSNTQTIALEAAYKKRNELKNCYLKEGTNINPLVLIQIPNSETGDQKVEAIKEFLNKKKINENNEKLAIWLSGNKSLSLTDDINDVNSKIEYLIFKQAIDTGWDCPRAQILIKFREIQSEIFNIQTVGRILRTAERKHYLNENLNRGYIFTNLKSVEVQKENYNFNIIKNLSSYRKKVYQNINLISYFKSRIDYGDIEADYQNFFEKEMCEFFAITNFKTIDQNYKKLEKKGFNINIKKFEQEILKNAKIDSEHFDEIDKIITNKDNFIKLSVAENDLQDFFEKFIKSNLNSFGNIKRSVPKIKTAIYRWFKKYIGSDNWNESLLLIQKIILDEKNSLIISEIINASLENYKSSKEKEIINRQKKSELRYDFEINNQEYYNVHEFELVNHSKFLFDKCYLNINRSNPEKEFEKFIDNQKDVIWWYKNKENKKDYFAIKYFFPKNRIRSFYPDYLVKLNDQSLLILEVKDKNDRDGFNETKAKNEALQEYIINSPKKKIIGGITIMVNNKWVLNQQKKYDWSKCLKNNWEDWKNLF